MEDLTSFQSEVLKKTSFEGALPLFSSVHLIVFWVIENRIHGEHIPGTREDVPSLIFISDE